MNDADRSAKVLKRVLAGRTRLLVTKRKGGHRQEIGVVTYVPLGPRRNKKLLRFAEFLRTLDGQP